MALWSDVDLQAVWDSMVERIYYAASSAKNTQTVFKETISFSKHLQTLKHQKNNPNHQMYIPCPTIMEAFPLIVVNDCDISPQYTLHNLQLTRTLDTWERWGFASIYRAKRCTQTNWVCRKTCRSTLLRLGRFNDDHQKIWVSKVDDWNKTSSALDTQKSEQPKTNTQISSSNARGPLH